MGKGIFSSTKSYAKNLATHVRRLLTRQETAGEALTRIKSDSLKLKHSLGSSESDKGSKEALRLLRKGRTYYNAQDYDAAETYFQNAVAQDPQCTLALTYLGHTFYQTNRLKEAKAAWQRAYTSDPHSRAGMKALKKLRHVAKGEAEVIQELLERTQR